MAVTLCLDFGNTKKKIALFDEDNLVEVLSLPEEGTVKTLENIITQYKVTQSILSSVVRHNEGIEQLLKAATHFHLLNYDTQLPFASPVAHPSTIGADRLALCAAAVFLNPYQHSLVISLGTCITYNFINNQGLFLGGGIAPGLYMRLKALKDQTALLPLVTPTSIYPLIGYDTKTNILSGVLGGMRYEIDGTIGAYKEKFNHLHLLMTGGDLGYFVSSTKYKIFADPNLIFKGLYAIYKNNL